MNFNNLRHLYAIALVLLSFYAGIGILSIAIVALYGAEVFLSTRGKTSAPSAKESGDTSKQYVETRVEPFKIDRLSHLDHPAEPVPVYDLSRLQGDSFQPTVPDTGEENPWIRAIEQFREQERQANEELKNQKIIINMDDDLTPREPIFRCAEEQIDTEKGED